MWLVGCWPSFAAHGFLRMWWLVGVVHAFWVARVACGEGCVTWRVHSLLLTLVTWVCDGQVWLLGGCHGLWVARDVCGGGGDV